MSDPKPSISWTVGKQTQTTGRLPNGQYGPGVDIPVTLSNGDEFTVFVPAAEYTNINFVKAAIQSAVMHHVAVSTLAGTAE